MNGAPGAPGSSGFGGGSGGSKSTAEMSKFSGGGDASNVSISGARQAGKAAQGRGGVMGALASAKAMMGDSLKTGSAMAARSKWGQAFGVGGGGKTGELAYGSSGLVQLDTIKSGAIDNLKTTDAGSLKVTPVKDLESEAKDINLAKMNGAQGADAAKEALQNAVSAVGSKQPNAKDQNTGKTVEMPPQEVIDIATKEPPEGTFCPDGCGTGANYYKDSKISYSKNDQGTWQAAYEGKQGGLAYKDVVEIHPEKPPGEQIEPVGSLISENGVWTKAEEFGSSEPAAE